jgi:hypothetical protein
VDLRHGLNITVGLIEPDRPWGAEPVIFRVAADCAPGRQRLNVSVSSARAAVLMAVGRLISWIVLLGVLAVCMAVAVLALAGGSTSTQCGLSFPCYWEPYFSTAPNAFAGMS